MASEGSKIVRLRVEDLFTTRDGAVPDKDARLTNCFIEDVQGKPQVIKRPGYALSTSVAAGVGHGITVVTDPDSGDQRVFQVNGNGAYYTTINYAAGAATVLLHLDATIGAQSTTDVYGHTITWAGGIGAININSSQKKFGAGALYSTNGDSYIYASGVDTGVNPIAANSVWTAECFVWCDQVDAFLHNIMGLANTYKIFGIAAWVQAGESKIRVSASNNNSSNNLANNVDTVISAGTNVFSDSAWHHCAVCFSGTAFNFYWDGALIYSVATTTCYAPKTAYVGSDALENTRSVFGYIDEFRLVGSNTGGTVPSSAYSR